MFRSFFRWIAPALLCLLALGWAACTSDSDADNGSTTTEPVTRTPVKVPSFNRDSAYAFVERQVAFGPRVVNTPAHAATRRYLVEQLKSFGLEVTEQNFTATAYTGEKLNSTNIIARYKPAAARRVMLFAHWDSRPFADSPLNEGDKTAPVLGADDGASGVGVLLEIARLLQDNPLDRGIDIVLLDAEDYGDSGGDPETYALGAQYFARNLPAGPRPEYGILLDMVGAKNARFPVEAYSIQFAPEVVRSVWGLADQMGLGNYFVPENGGAITDDHYFINTIAGIPTIDIINRTNNTETGFGAHWHTDGDDMSVIDSRTLRAVGQVVLAVIYRDLVM